MVKYGTRIQLKNISCPQTIQSMAYILHGTLVHVGSFWPTHVLVVYLKTSI
jgi:hypothetical protein